MNLKRIGRIAKWLSAFAVLGLFSGIGAIFYISQDLPQLESLEDYKPSQATQIYSDDGHLVAYVANQRRTVIPMEAIPKHVAHAFLAAEDRNFYSHEGLDYLGILRAAVKNLRPGAHLQGASTITQQIVKTMVLGPERSYSRKMREAVLSFKLENSLSKDDILHIYLNQIYFGSGAWGVEQAAQTYFGISARNLNVAQAAYLASAPKHPARYNIKSDAAGAQKRQHYVLSQMLAAGWADEETVNEAKAAPIPAPAPKPPYLDVASHYTEWVIRELTKEYGTEAVYEGGLTVYTGMQASHQKAGVDAIRNGLENLGKKNGWPGASLRIEVNLFETYHNEIRKEFAKLYERRKLYTGAPEMSETPVWDFSKVSAKDLVSEIQFRKKMVLKVPKVGMRLTAIVSAVNSSQNTVTVDLGGFESALTLKSLEWARRFSPTAATPSPRDPTDVLQRGDLIEVILTSLTKSAEAASTIGKIKLVPNPKVQGALFSIDPHTRYVRAMVGGYQRQPGGLNRAMQSLRQPGSVFKPILYATALKEKIITPASICPDAPVVIRDKWTGKAWKPENYQDGRYDGNITYRRALTRSKNTCSVKLLEMVGVEKVRELARNMGIGSRLPENLTLALGTGEVTPMELANSYATIASGGFYAKPIFIRKVVSLTGDILQENRANPTQVLDADVAFVITHMMQSVIEEGTGVRAKRLERALAGKTGTTNQSRNAWFAGFSPETVAVTWVGFDDNAPMGRATGSSAALPIWVDYLDHALKDTPRLPFRPPPEVVFRRVDADTGTINNDIGSIEEVFVAGTAPEESAQELESIFIDDEDGLDAQLQ